MLARIDARGHRTDYAYDAAGRRIRTVLPEAFDAVSGTVRRAATTEEWDADGRLTAMVDARGGRTQNTYDAAGRRLRVRYADGTSREEHYNTTGRVTERPAVSIRSSTIRTSPGDSSVSGIAKESD